ncbi:MAG: hypothetical protein JXR07_15135 [Reichenbachiella sp.]
MKIFNLLATCIILGLLSCEDKSIDPNSAKLAVGIWETYEYQLNTEDGFQNNHSPYVILNEYGSGFGLTSNFNYYTGYSEGTNPFPDTGIYWGTWKFIGSDKIEFTKTDGENKLIVVIEQLGSDTLHIKYENSEIEYKLRRIE